MALQKVSLAVTFEGGVETKSDPKRVPAARLLHLENVVFRRDTSTFNGNGTNALCKRNGYEALIEDGIASGSSLRAMGVRDDELLVFDDDRCYSYSEGRGRWDDAGAVVSASITDRVVAKTGAEQTDADSYTLDGVRFVAWSQGGGVWWSAIDEATNRVLSPPAQLAATGQTPRVTRSGALVHIYWADPGAVSALVAVASPSNPAVITAPAVVVSDLSVTSPGFDVAPTTTAPNDAAIIAWVSSAGTARWGYVDPIGFMGSSGSGYPDVVSSSFSTVEDAVAVTVDDVAGQAAIAVCRGGINGARLVFVTLSTLAQGHDVEMPLTDGANRIACAYRATAVAGYRPVDIAAQITSAPARDCYVVRLSVVDAAGSATATNLGDTNGAGLASGAASESDSGYVWLCHDVESFSVYMLTRILDGLVVARYLPGGAAHGLPSGPALPGLVADGRVLTWAGTYNEVVTEPVGSAKTFTETGIRVAAVDFGDDSSHQSGQLGGCLYLGGASVQQYDGQRWAEAGFHYAPDGITPTPSTGGSLTPSTSYLYGFSYEDINAQGEVDRGPVAFVAVVLGVGQDRVNINVPTYRLTQRRNVRIAVWRSPSNDASALYRVTSLDPTATTGSNRFIANDTFANTIAFVDDMSDAVLVAREPLYTNGGIPSNDPIAGSGILTVGKGRVFTADPVDPLLVRYSQQLADGFGVEFVPQLAIKVDPVGGPITGLDILDDKLVVFKRDAVLVVTGPGPAAAPDLDRTVGFSEPQLVTSDAGCSRAESIATCPVGLVFQSRKGIYMLGRDLQLQYVGAPVEAYNAQTVRAATLAPDRTHVVFLTDSGSTLLWDYFFQQWSTFSNHEGVDAVVVGGVYHYLRNDGRVFRETPGVFRDANAHIRRTVETAWIKFTGALQGFQRIYHASLLGRYVSPHTLRVRCQTDYEESWSQLWNINVSDTHTEANYGDGVYGAGPFGGAAMVRYQERVHVGKKCQAIRFQIQDVEATDDYGGAFELSELLITGGTKGPAYKVGATRST